MVEYTNKCAVPIINIRLRKRKDEKIIILDSSVETPSYFKLVEVVHCCYKSL